MPKAILKNGAILPLEPLPVEWKDGRELSVEAADEPGETDAEFDVWLAELQALCAGNDPDDLVQVEQRIRVADSEAKSIVRKEMGLP
jgi:hypothetical protein